MFEESFKKGIFPEIRKRANVVPVRKNEGKTLKNITVLLVYFQLLVKFLK